MSPLQRQIVIQEARSWIGTPYHHHGRIKGVGVDCAMLLAEVFACAGVIEPVALEHYPRDWHLHRDDERFIGYLQLFGCVEVDQPAPADVALFRTGRAYGHAAIIVEWPRGIHAVNGRGVELDDLSLNLLDRRGRSCPVRFFRFTGEST